MAPRSKSASALGMEKDNDNVIAGNTWETD
jgi:hypothetical protein